MADRSNRTIGLCNSDKCTGCECCYNICPTNSIVMTFNQYGESFPKINMNTCIQCGKCMKYCHVLCDCEKNESYKCFAAVRKDKNKRENCSSGGISSLLAEKVIGRDGVFYGVVFSRTDGAVYKRITSVEEIHETEGSKYVQASIGNVFNDIKQDLINKLEVLFIGSACQCAGLKMFLNGENICTDKLLLVVFLCHGIVPKSFLDDEIAHLEDKNNFVCDEISFRSNDSKKNYYLSLYYKKRIIYKRKAELQPYFYCFLKSISLRENCLSCKYKNINRVSDITIGDFIGLERNSINDLPPNCNPSLILINTEKGCDVFKKIEGMLYWERNVKEAVKGGPSLRGCVMPDKKRERFRELYIEYGFAYAARKVANKDIVVNYMVYLRYLILRYFKAIIKRLLFRINKNS